MIMGDIGNVESTYSLWLIKIVELIYSLIFWLSSSVIGVDKFQESFASLAGLSEDSYLG